MRYMTNGVAYLKKLMLKSGSGLVVAFVLLCTFLAISSGNFLTTSNIIVVIRQAVWIATISIGMTFIISTGEIDLSVGSIVGFSGMFAAALMQNYGLNIYLTLILTLIVGGLIGLVNGFMVAKVKIASFIATLAMMQVLRGLIYVYTKGIPIFGLDYNEFTVWAQGEVGFVPVPIIILIILVIIFWYVLYRTKFGRHLLSVGSNIDSARLVGINIQRIKLSVYVITGVLCAIAGIFVTARSEAAVVEAGSGYEVDAIAAVVIAGTSMTGGKANLLGCILGAVLMTTIRNGLNLLKVESTWHQVAIGIVIILALIFDVYTNKESRTA